MESFKRHKFTKRRPALTPGVISPTYTVPKHIKTPEYATHQGALGSRGPYADVKSVFQQTPILKPEEMIIMRNTSKVVRETMEYIRPFVKSGVTTDEIDRKIFEFATSKGAYPSSLFYGPRESPFPKSICTSVNEVICHGIPDSRPLQPGDIVNVDFALYKDGFHSDMSETFIIDDVDEDTRKLVEISRECLYKAIEQLHPGQDLSIIGQTISKHLENTPFISLDFVYGHGVGKNYHDKPSIYHTYNKKPGTMRPGMAFTIEPIIVAGKPQVITWDDNWTVACDRGTLSAQFEHTVLITEDGVEVLTGP